MRYLQCMRPFVGDRFTRNFLIAYGTGTNRLNIEQPAYGQNLQGKRILYSRLGLLEKYGPLSHRFSLILFTVSVFVIKGLRIFLCICQGSRPSRPRQKFIGQCLSATCSSPFWPDCRIMFDYSYQIRHI